MGTRASRWTLAATATALVAAAVATVVTATAASAAADPPDDPAAGHPQSSEGFVLFKGNNAESLNGVSYHTFRIPAVVRTKAGTLLAFAEGRVASHKDFGNINLLYKRGRNDGRKPSDWSGLKQAAGVGMGTWGNPTPVVDRDTGTIWLFLSWNAEDKSQSGGANPDTGKPTTPITKWGERRVFAMKSVDDGETFTGANGEDRPTDLTESLLPKEKPSGEVWDWDAVGPGAGTQTSSGALVIPAQHRNIYSTDHGKTWKPQQLGEQTGEATITQLSNGELYRNDRPTGRSWETAKRRWVSRGTLDGRFSAFQPDDKLLDPRNEASVLQYNTDAPARTIFLNSASTDTRTKMRVRISYDDAQTWPRSRPLSESPIPDSGTEGGYSSMAKTDDFHIGALVETNLRIGDPNSPKSIIFRRFNLSWILHGCEC
ncbi:A/G-specific DNA-adenine glycosylase [Herbihabitans rhizosphaerae]|uniref:exo-alpha-sialidase n=1 Tax=Herbihabitans rhizosphaerae TaxID=1872711 RepID=A0A4Q7L5Q4_9PSEU|nr:sialidase family protein [Herbihabitans rhizosphaerae]RZS44979.1 A/G-specific DNA-adenine glycosylase [Herbihabitans rhizosphaerae]